MNPEQAWNILAQVVNQTRALPQEVDAMRQALEVLREKIAAKESKNQEKNKGV